MAAGRRQTPDSGAAAPFKKSMLLTSVALLAALVGHVVIDVLGDFMLADDTHDDISHLSRIVIALATLGLTLLGVEIGLRELQGFDTDPRQAGSLLRTLWR